MLVGKVSVILPAFNERDNLIRLVPQIHDSLGAYEHEIIVIDDNSSDGTYDAMSILKAQVTTLRPTQNAYPRGLASSIRSGIEEAEGNIFVVMDSDGNHQARYLPFMIENLKYFDCVSASRFLYGGTMQERPRQILSWLFNIFTRLSIGGQITDNLYGFFAIKYEILKQIDFDKVFWGYGDYYIRLLFYLQSYNTSILQFPAVNGHRAHGAGQSKFIRLFVKYFAEVARLAYRARVIRNV